MTRIAYPVYNNLNRLSCTILTINIILLSADKHKHLLCLTNTLSIKKWEYNLQQRVLREVQEDHLVLNTTKKRVTSIVNSNNSRAQCIIFYFKPLVTAVDMLRVLHYSPVLRRQGRQHQRCTSPEVTGFDTGTA